MELNRPKPNIEQNQEKKDYDDVYDFNDKFKKVQQHSGIFSCL